jgi:hypothetical protein
MAFYSPRRDERKRGEESLSKAAAESEARERRQAEEAKQEKEALRRTYDKQVGLGSRW